jgi:hypothetical protein
VEGYVPDEDGAALGVNGFCEGEVDTCVIVLNRVGGECVALPEPPLVIIAPLCSNLVDDAIVFEGGVVADCVVVRYR